VAASIDGTVVTWDAQTGKRVSQVDLDAKKTGEPRTISQILGMDLSPNGRTIAIAYSRDQLVGTSLEGKPEYRIGLLDAQTGLEERNLSGHTNQIGTLAFSPDGKLLASESADRSVRLWNVETGKEVFSLKMREKGSTIAFSPNGRLIAIASQPTFENPPLPIVALYDAESGRLVREFPRRKTDVTSVAFSPDSQCLAIAANNLKGGQIDLWDLTAKEPKATFTDRQAGITSITFSTDGQLLASGHLQDHGGAVVVQMLGTNKSRVHNIASGVSAVTFSRDSRMLAAGTETGQIVLLTP
jgi:WD40 repeat protein